MLRTILLAPGRFVDAWLATIREQRRLRRDHPHGGRCHTCGTETPAGVDECPECFATRAW